MSLELKTRKRHIYFLNDYFWKYHRIINLNILNPQFYKIKQNISFKIILLLN